MRPVKQSTRGGASAPPRERGDCFSACLASILEIPLDRVPRFCEIDDPVEWHPAINLWLGSFARFWVELAWSPYLEEAIAPASGWSVISGMGPRGNRHAVVGYRGKPHFDPHPDVSPYCPQLLPHDPDDDDKVWTLGLIVQQDPWRPS